MQRICSSLSCAGYDVTLIGRKLRHSQPFKPECFRQKRLSCIFSSGKLFYVEFNLRLFLHLLFISADCFCAIDLDTILPNYFASKLRKKKRAYDAHELFTEQKEVVTRPAIHKLWLKVERFAVPKFPHGYTVNEFIVAEFKRRYGVVYTVVRNLPKLANTQPQPEGQEPFIIYQGAVNEGRSFETLIPAMKQVDAKLVVCGDGNFFEQLKQLIKQHHVDHKVELKGMLPPGDLKQLTPKAYAAVMLFEDTGLNQYQSLANRFFDYIMAGVPQICVAYPQYTAVNDIYDVALLIDDTSTTTIATALNDIMHNKARHQALQQNCLKARAVLNWESEEKVLVSFYNKLMNG